MAFKTPVLGGTATKLTGKKAAAAIFKVPAVPRGPAAIPKPTLRGRLGAFAKATTTWIAVGIGAGVVGLTWFIYSYAAGEGKPELHKAGKAISDHLPQILLIAGVALVVITMSRRRS